MQCLSWMVAMEGKTGAHGECNGKRKQRHNYTGHQLRILEENFMTSRNGYLPRERTLSIAEELGVNVERIVIWYQNRRAKYKRGKLTSRNNASSFSLLPPADHPYYSESNTFANSNFSTPLSLDPKTTRTPDCTDKPITEHELNPRGNVKSVIRVPAFSESKNGDEISDNIKPSFTIHYSQTCKTQSHKENGGRQGGDQTLHHQGKKRRISAPVEINKETKPDATNVEERPKKPRRRTTHSLSLPIILPRPSVHGSDSQMPYISAIETTLQIPNISSDDTFQSRMSATHSTEPPLISSTASNPEGPDVPSLSSYDVSQSVISNAGSNLASVMSGTSPTQKHQSEVSSISSDIPFQSITSQTASNPPTLMANTTSYQDTPNISSDPRFYPWLPLKTPNPALMVPYTESDQQHGSETSSVTSNSKAGMLLTDSNQAPVMSTRLANQEVPSSKQAHQFDMSTLPSNLQQNSDIPNSSTQEQMPPSPRDSEQDQAMTLKLLTIPYKPPEPGPGSPEEGQCNLVISQVCSLVDHPLWHSPTGNLEDSMQGVTLDTSSDMSDAEHPLDLRTKDIDQQCEQSLEQDDNAEELSLEQDGNTEEQSLEQENNEEDSVAISNISTISTSRRCIISPDDVTVMYSSYRDHQEVESCNDNNSHNDDNYGETSDNAADTETDHQTNDDEKCIRLPWFYIL